MIQPLGYELRDKTGRVIERDIVDTEITVTGRCLTRRFLKPITVRSGQTISYFVPPGYSPVSVADPYAQIWQPPDPPPPTQPTGPLITIKCYCCRGLVTGHLDILKSAGWKDIEIDYSSPASDPSYLGLCPGEDCGGGDD